MVKLAVLFALLVALSVAAGSYPRWGADWWVWGGHALWLLATIVVGAIIVSLVDRRA